MFASYGSSAHTFTAMKPEATDVFVPTTGSLKQSNFKDHDDWSVHHNDAPPRFLKWPATTAVV